MPSSLRVGNIRQAGDAQTQDAINSVARNIEMRSKYGTDDPDNSVSGKVYFKLSSTTSGRWTKVDEVWIAT